MDIHSAKGIQRQKTKKRFEDEQLISLESLFHTESRPESQRKQQIADQLGLEPRQVAIWFQNKRARCKTKQTEHDYSILKGSYDDLSARFESLRKVNQSLDAELQRLKNLEKKPGSSRKDEFNSNDLKSNEETQCTHSILPATYTTAHEDSHHELFSEDEAKSTHQYLEQYADIINIFKIEEQPHDSVTSSRDSAERILEQNFSSEWWEALG